MQPMPAGRKQNEDYLLYVTTPNECNRNRYRQMHRSNRRIDHCGDYKLTNDIV